MPQVLLHQQRSAVLCPTAPLLRRAGALCGRRLPGPGPGRGIQCAGSGLLQRPLRVSNPLAARRPKAP